jgi:hypothetical protein
MGFLNISGIRNVYIGIGVTHVSKPRCVGDLSAVSIWHL